MATVIHSLKKELRSKASPKKAKDLQRFFKTGPGEYGEGDVFLGVMVPNIRQVVKKFSGIKMVQVLELLHSKFHEERLTALLILVKKFKQGSEKEKIYNFYLKNTKYINNWDLVDLSAHKIVGEYLFFKNKSILYKLAKSKNLWERRIAVLATFYFIKNNKFKESLKIAKMLLKDEQDLIHKAAGWMLREIGKRNLVTEEEFLKKHAKQMPRTMLRYAIEKFSEEKRKRYLGLDKLT